MGGGQWQTMRLKRTESRRLPVFEKKSKILGEADDDDMMMVSCKAIAVASVLGPGTECRLARLKSEEKTETGYRFGLCFPGAVSFPSATHRVSAMILPE